MKRANLDSRIREQIDSCRPGSEDTDQPELAALADLLEQDSRVRDVLSRSQQLDEAVGEAFREVPVPAGLAARLLTAVGASEDLLEQSEATSSADSISDQAVESLAADSAPDADVERSSGDHEPARKRGSTRRRLLIAASSAAAMLVVAVYAAVVLNQTDGPTSASQIAELAISWVDAAQQEDWEPAEDAPAKKFPLAAEIEVESGQAAITQWQYLSTRFGKAATYDLTPPGKGFVYQFAIRTSEDFSAPQLLPSSPQQNTQGMCIGVAYRQGMLYVLVVEGDERRYSRFIKKRHPVI